MPWDENKTIGVNMDRQVPTKEIAKYKREEKEAQYKSKKSRVEHETSSSHRAFSARSPSIHGNGFLPMHYGHKTLLDFLDQGCRDDVDAKVFRFLYACGITFNVLQSPYWHEMVEAIQSAPNEYKSPEYDKAKTMELDKKKTKIQTTLGKFTNAWNKYGVSMVSDGWINVKGKLLTACGAIFLSSHDYLDQFKASINIAEPLLKTIESIGPYNVIQIIIDNAANCEAVGAIIEDKYPNIFGSGCLVHILNLLMHDIIKMKEHDYKWIGSLYKREKFMIRFITNYNNSHGIFRSHSKFELLKMAKTRFASYYLTFRHLLKVRETLASMVSSESW